MVGEQHTGTMSMDETGDPVQASTQRQVQSPQPQLIDPVTKQQNLATRDQPAAEPAKTITRDNPTLGMPERVTIIVEDNESIPPTGQMVGVNGYVYCLKPGVPVTVPVAVVSVLEDAVISRAIIDPATKKVVGHRNQLRFPFRVVSDSKALARA